VKRGFLGITMNPTGINEKAKGYYKLSDNNGVIVADVADKGPAASAGLRKNDIIRKIDGDPVKDNRDLVAKIASRKPGETVKLEILRGGDTMNVDVKLATRQLDQQASESEPDQEESTPKSDEGLGITVQTIPADARQQLKMNDDAPGVMIVSVDPESDAAEEGLEPRQFITSIDNKPLKSVAEWNRVVTGLKPGETVKLDVTTYVTVRGDRVEQNEIVFLSVPHPKSK
jgi:serine protease Do